MATDETNRDTPENKRKEAMLTGLYDEYYDRIARFAYVRLGNRADAEDIAGETFLKALKSLDSYQERGAPMQAWLFTIARNLINDHYRRAQRKPTVPIGDFDTAGDDDPAGDVERKLEMERVNAAMARLTSDQQEVLRLRFYAGLNSKETAEVLQKSDIAVRQMQHNGIQKLKQLLMDKASGTTK
jgi:RNA polymerase sigma-70 factor (ECF subfamily)